MKRIFSINSPSVQKALSEVSGEDVPNHIFTEPEDLADEVVFMLPRPLKLWMHDVRVEL